MANFKKALPIWLSQGNAPSDSLTKEGWKVKDHPPASVFNWNWNTTYNALKELQEKSALDKDLSKTTNDLKTHVDNKKNPHNVTKKQVGLGNVDDTGDLQKPVSLETKKMIEEKEASNSAALNKKLDISAAVNFQQDKIWEHNGLLKIISGKDLLDVTQKNSEYYVTNAVNGPASATSGFVSVRVRAGNYIVVTFTAHSSHDVYSNSYNGSSKQWVGWERMALTKEVSNLRDVVSKKVDSSKIASYQAKKITEDNGKAAVWLEGSDVNVYDELVKLERGYYSCYIGRDTVNSPGITIRGTIVVEIKAKFITVFGNGSDNRIYSNHYDVNKTGFLGWKSYANKDEMDDVALSLKLKVNKEDIKNYQKTAVTSPDGGAEFLQNDTASDFLVNLLTLGKGFHTVYCVGGAKNNPAGKYSVRGTFHLTGIAAGSEHGVVTLIDVKGNEYHTAISDGNWSPWKSDKITLWSGRAKGASHTKYNLARDIRDFKRVYIHFYGGMGSSFVETFEISESNNKGYVISKTNLSSTTASNPTMFELELNFVNNTYFLIKSDMSYNINSSRPNLAANEFTISEIKGEM